MNRYLITSLLAALTLAGTGCTENQRARNWGGTATIELAAGRKLVNATFKQDNLWILTRAAKPGETPETYEMKEDSSFGVIQGTVILREK